MLAWLRRRFITGFFVTVPLIVSVAALVWGFRVVDGVTAPLYQRLLGRDVPGLGLLTGAVAVLVVGVLAANVIGRRVLQRLEHWLLLVPVFRTVYAPVKQLIVAFSPDNETGFKQVVLVEDPARGAILGFLTREFLVTDSAGTARPMAAVYVPTNHLYLGDVFVYPRERLQFPDLSVEEGIRIFLTGGNQLRLSTTLGGTPVAKLIRRRNAQGAVVAGTSAGAAFLSEHMVATGEEGATPHAGSVTLSPGLGLTNRVIIDQHFRQRDRLGRLLTALAYNPFAIGLGLDEDTAAFIGPDNTLDVVGTGAITVVDPAEVEFSSMDQAEKNDPVCLIGVRLHVLVRGASFDLHARKAYAPHAVSSEQ